MRSSATQIGTLRRGRLGTTPRCWASIAVAATVLVLAAPRPGRSISLDERVPNLFGGHLNTTVRPGFDGPFPLQFADQFRSLSAALSTAHALAPVPSASGAFRFGWDPEVDTFKRVSQSLGSGFAERAATLGKRTATISVSYSHTDFDTLEGDSLHHLRFTQPAVSTSQLNLLPPSIRKKFADDVLQTDLRLTLSLDVLYLTAAFGLTDRMDASIALSVARAQMSGTAVSTIINSKNNGGVAAFVTQPPNNTLAAPSGRLCSPGNLQCATDSFSDSAWGTGDLLLRLKYHLYDASYANFAFSSVVTLPTGNADNFLGFHDPTLTPWLIVSKQFGWFSPHLNLGHAFRSSEDVSQSQWIVGGDALATRWLTVFSDFIGFHDDKRDSVNDDVYQSAIGFKVNPFGNAVFSTSFQFPLNRDGVRADTIYAGQLEYTF